MIIYISLPVLHVSPDVQSLLEKLHHAVGGAGCVWQPTMGRPRAGRWATKFNVIHKPENFNSTSSSIDQRAVFNVCSEVSRLFAMFFYASKPGPRQVRSHKRMARISVSSTPSIDCALHRLLHLIYYYSRLVWQNL